MRLLPQFPALFLLVAVSFCDTAEARIYRLWGGKVTIDVPAGIRFRPNGPNAYMALSLVPGANSRVVTLIVTRSVGFSGNPDWSSLTELWRQSLRTGSGLRAFAGPRGVGNTFNVEVGSGVGRSSSRHKLRAFHRSRSHGLDLLNLHTVTLTAVPSSAWGAPEGRALLRAFNSVRVRR